MTMKRYLPAITALLLVFSLLTSCTYLSMIHDALSGYVHELADFRDLRYERPDITALDEDIDDLMARMADYEREDMLERLTDLVDRFYYDFQTMRNLAYLEYAKDMTDTYYRDEYYLLMTEGDRLMARLDELYGYLAMSEDASYFEEKLFGEDFFQGYADEPNGYPEELVLLMQRESELLRDYGEAMTNIAVEYEGKIYTEADLDAIEDEALYRVVCEAYYQKYNKLLGDIYVELVGVRQALSVAFGYRSFDEYAYTYYHAREYTPDEAKVYLEGIRTHLVPVYDMVMQAFDADRFAALPRLSPTDVVQKTQTVIKRIANATSWTFDLADVYKEMVDNNLYTVGASPTMYYGSFQTYFPSVETPYLFVNGSGYADDLLTMTHEFGHFASAYYNFGNTGSNDEAEVASQALELLSLRYLNNLLSDEEIALLREYELYNLLSSLNECAAYTAFEDMVYADETPTLEECNAYFSRCMDDYGLSDYSESGVGGNRYWVFINHLIEYPYYMIGYSVSADVSIQIYELGGVKSAETYMELMDRAYLYDFFGNLEAVGLSSPFEEGRAAAVAAFFTREWEVLAA